ncbi:hypothetical protein CROQUDRAFT_717430 [Cronartium quercuum f. sp. fusiforme G11]|uniref:tRNA-splicing endonuclease subunit Sen15 domain-containing protein n=1 Tax=Cronartium quercuum f. sp. fusiforme G11 TaxID=708437 RepID=A0A9P6NAG0_9BASI|nr:hypothetical protein CROQUDRAFT_717430 [Cronartium quercuum f. sp. fusiforme G11]
MEKIIKEAIENPSGTQAYETLQKAIDERLSMIPIIISLIFDAQEPIIKRTIAGTMLNQVLDKWKFSCEEERNLGDQLIKRILGSSPKFMTTIENRLLDISLSYLIKSKIETGKDVNDSSGLGDLSKVRLSTLYRIIKTLSRENNQTLKVKVSLKKTSFHYGEMFWEIYSKSQPQSETFYLSLKILTLFALHFNQINLSVFVQRALIDLDIAINQAYEERIILRYGKFFNQLDSIPESVLIYYAKIVEIDSGPNQINVPKKIFLQACEITFKAIFDSNTDLEKVGLTTDHVDRWIDRILWKFLEDEDESLQMIASDLFQLFAKKSRSNVKTALEKFINCKLSNIFKRLQPPQEKVLLAIVSTDSSIVYYELATGIVSPKEVPE